MQPQSATEYTSLLTEVIKKQIVILGPDITLAKARNVPGLTVADDGTVTAITGQPQQITQSLIDQFVQLSGLIVKKTMEPLLSYHADGTTPAPMPVVAPVAPVISVPSMPNPMPMQMPQQPSQPMTMPVQTTPEQPAPQMQQAMPVTPIQAPQMMQQPVMKQPMPQPAPASTSNMVGTNATGAATEPPVPTNQIDTETQRIIDEALKSNG